MFPQAFQEKVIRIFIKEYNKKKMDKILIGFYNYFNL